MNLQNSLRLTVLLPAVILTGCAYSTTLSPPTDSRNIHFSATVPADLESLPLSAMYRSEKCTRNRTSGSGKSYEVPGFNSAKYPLSITATGDVSADIPVNGGGYCDWKLSNIVFEVKLRDPAKIEPLISKNHGEEATFVFDNHAPATFDGGYEKQTGDVNEELILFPLITESFIGGHEKSFWLIGKYETLTYKVKNVKNINLTIDYKSDMKTHRIGIKKKEENAMATFIYPDGEQEKTRELFPEYKKLMKMYNDRKK
ncbi:hypothetical protein [Morganella morganii]|uniref:hypothetical protein n=1 Tax=Morganella morganii TaxID=582 RepID=UPI001BDA3734|nr:hypothetical protein [Morganella morganii]EKT0591721.1 hypothetical protein [Morganella morganii]MBT0394190.1 hypothetical protein [Morganella morganii subsp. morganii]